MKIKRFEASSMAEALRMIKKEFGEDAVILSAKTMKKPGRFLGIGAGGQVVVTAAVDQPEAKQPQRDGARQMDLAMGDRSGERALNAEKPVEGIGRILRHFTPITRTGRKKMQPKFDQLLTEINESSATASLAAGDKNSYEQLTEQGLGPSLASELSEKMDELIASREQTEEDAVSILSQIIDAKGWVAQRISAHGAGPRIVILVGPPGTGKTTVAAQMAARAMLDTHQKVGIISLDDHRIAGAAELQRYAEIMGAPFESVQDGDGWDEAMARLSSTQLVVVDTPGLGPLDTARRDMLGRLLKSAVEAEIHLVLCAGTREPVMARIIDFFTPLGVNRLLPTHMDWAGQLGPFINQMARSFLPMGYMGSGPQVPEGIQRLTARNLAATLLSREDNPEEHEQNSAVTIVQRHTAPAVQAPYVANRNSDIFHQHDCKSVSRISDANILRFKDAQEAIERNFKPCRMCCLSLIVPKPIDRLVRARVAGNRN